MPKIMQRIADVGQRMQADPLEAERIRSEAVAAITNGKADPAWEKYMSNFGSGEQLQRLLGNDAVFNGDKYASTILAYIVAAGPCTLATGALRMAREMPADFAVLLDAGVTD